MMQIYILILLRDDSEIQGTCVLRLSYMTRSNVELALATVYMTASFRDSKDLLGIYKQEVNHDIVKPNERAGRQIRQLHRDGLSTFEMHTHRSCPSS